MDRKRTANFAAAFMRKIGPLLPEHQVGRDNLRAAFPKKSAAEIEQILGGVWDNLGRIGVEFAHLDEFCVAGGGHADAGRHHLRAGNGGALRTLDRKRQTDAGFAAHLANWELPALVGKVLGADTAVLYRRPNIPPVSDLIVKLRAPLMGELVATGLRRAGAARAAAASRRAMSAC